MPFRSVSITAIMIFFFGVLVWTFTYGPARRTFVVPGKTITVQSVSEIDGLWHTSGLHGRIAVIFARHLNLLSLGSSFPDGSYLDNAMYHGIVRKAYYIVPDRFWPEIISLNKMKGALIVPLKPTDTGFIMLHEAGRIHIMPLSKYIPETGDEKALVVLEPRVWPQEEQSRIEGFIKTGQLITDLMAVVGGEATSAAIQN
ncbi:MAG: hypothetical protein AB1306_02060 [Nitrospirota bacterium]